MTTIPGIHHVTAIAGPAQANVDFYAGRLRRRLIKRTVNFDAPEVYHLYYGDHTGRPGSILTFFPHPEAAPGQPGPGMAAGFAYAVPPAEFEALAADLAGVAQGVESRRFGERVLTLRDPDGAAVELIATEGAADGQAFHSVTLWEDDPDPTLRLLTEVFGYAVQGQEREGATERTRLVAPGGAEASILDVIRREGATPGRAGPGTIHHIAFRTGSDQEQKEWQARLADWGRPTTEVRDRQYFKSIYFREPGGILFEIATDPPGFTVDEPLERLGNDLKLPPQHEPLRARLEQSLPPLRVPPA